MIDPTNNTTFVNKDSSTPIMAGWLNDVGSVVYKPSLKTNIGGVTIPDFVLDHSTPGSFVLYANTNPLDWAAGPGRMSVDFLLTSNSFFAANPNAHFAVVLRQDPATSGVAVRGQGIGVGNATGFLPTAPNPTSFIESWFNTISGAPGDHYIWTNSTLPSSRPLADGVPYRFNVESTKAVNDLRYIRYRIWQIGVTDGSETLLVDSGDVLDHNSWADLTQSALAFGFVFESNLVPGWNLAFTQTRVTWGPAPDVSTDQTPSLSRYGADLYGNVRFIDGGRVIQPFFDAGPSLTQWTAFQSQLLNGGTVMLAKPNGTSTVSGYMAVGTSNPDVSYQAVTFGMGSGVATVETFARSMANPVFGVNIGAGNRIATFSAAGLTVTGNTQSTTFNVATALQEIGQPSSVYSDVTAINGPIARAFANVGGPAFPLENFCVIGAIAGAIGGVYNANKVEDAIRPLWCMFSVMMGELCVQRKVF